MSTKLKIIVSYLKLLIYIASSDDWLRNAKQTEFHMIPIVSWRCELILIIVNWAIFKF